MNAQEMKDRMKYLEREIEDAECRLAHTINRKREIERMNANNQAFQRQLTRRYAAEMESAVNAIKGMKAELADLQDASRT